MSKADPTSARRSAPVLPAAARREDRGGRSLFNSPWVGMVLAAALLGASGGVRAWQDYRFGTALKETEAPPFALKDLPTELGAWKVHEGNETRLDPEVARIAGSSDHIVRTYTNQKTGVSVTLLALYGRATEVSGHSPEICYPSAGYVRVEGPELRDLRSPGISALFQSEVFAREGGDREEAYHAFLFNGRWIPNAKSAWKDFRHHPSIFKVQTQRHVSERERRDVNNPAEQFLAELLPEIERRLSQSRDKHDG